MTGFVSTVDGLTLLQALDSLRGGAVHWPDLAPLVIDRGDLVIVPLAKSDGGADADEQLQRIKADLQRDCIHFYGGDWFHAETLLDLDEGYGRVLARAGGVSPARLYAWSVGGFAVVLVHAADARGAGSTLALHFLPREWIWPRLSNGDTKRETSRRRRIAKERDAADAAWEWPDAV